MLYALFMRLCSLAHAVTLKSRAITLESQHNAMQYDLI